jgi:hypothetical protein
MAAASDREQGPHASPAETPPHQRRSRPGRRFLDSLADPNGELAREWDMDHERHVFEKLLAIVQPDFSPTTWAAFRRFAVDGLPSAKVAEDLGFERECRPSGQIAYSQEVTWRGRRSSRIGFFIANSEWFQRHSI